MPRKQQRVSQIKWLVRVPASEWCTHMLRDNQQIWATFSASVVPQIVLVKPFSGRVACLTRVSHNRVIAWYDCEESVAWILDTAEGARAMRERGMELEIAATHAFLHLVSLVLGVVSEQAQP